MTIHAASRSLWGPWATLLADCLVGNLVQSSSAWLPDDGVMFYIWIITLTVLIGAFKELSYVLGKIFGSTHHEMFPGWQLGFVYLPSAVGNFFTNHHAWLAQVEWLLTGSVGLVHFSPCSMLFSPPVISLFQHNSNVWSKFHVKSCIGKSSISQWSMTIFILLYILLLQSTLVYTGSLTKNGIWIAYI